MNTDSVIEYMEAGNMIQAPVPLASRQEVAEYLQLPPQTLAMWATKGKGPRYRRIGRNCRYDWADVHAWLATQSFSGAA